MEKKLWLWQNGDHFWAFEHLYPKVSPGGDPCTLGEPVGYALLKKSYSSDPREPDAIPAPEGDVRNALAELLDECISSYQAGTLPKSISWDRLIAAQSALAAPAPQAAPDLDLRDDVIATLRGQVADLEALCEERGRKLDELYATQDSLDSAQSSNQVARQAAPVALTPHQRSMGLADSAITDETPISDVWHAACVWTESAHSIPAPQTKEQP